ncbi:MAG: hypothetical protein ABH863_03255 [Candidatus Micrarchaeota archaeon]
MACFIVPATLGIITTAGRKKIPEKLHVGWLNIMIWGGAVGLAVEHIAHQEIVPWFPFLSAMHSAADTSIMLNEMAVVGIPMTLALVATWVGMVVVYEKVIAVKKAPVGASGI